MIYYSEVAADAISMQVDIKFVYLFRISQVKIMVFDNSFGKLDFTPHND
ncbi:MAG: hypothetical protein N2Z72_04450 [Bacteroidales bacterium]|nr:hypothetical protein [Bacteroidales bacterium]